MKARTLCNCSAADCVCGGKAVHLPAIREGKNPKGSKIPSRISMYEARVLAYELEGMTRSDAQGVVDAEDMEDSK